MARIVKGGQCHRRATDWGAVAREGRRPCMRRVERDAGLGGMEARCCMTERKGGEERTVVRLPAEAEVRGRVNM